jgi:hypothetical protein
MKITRQQLIEECLVRIETIQKHIQAVEAAGYCISSFKNYLKVDYGNLRDLLIDQELEQWRGLFMWGITADEVTRSRIKAMAYDRFLANGKEVMSWMNDGTSPSQYLVADEKKFRKMVRELFLKEEED